MMFLRKKIISKIVNAIINIFFYGVMVFVVFLLLRIFVFDSYKIPTDSMRPTIIPGDYILVNKLAYGARLYDIFEVAARKRVDIYRVPGCQKVERNDIVVFNMLFPNTKEKIEMRINKFFVKRCIALPGDTLYIKNGFYQINSDSLNNVGYYKAQSKLSKKSKEELHNVVYESFPWDSAMGWTIKDFGPLYLPKKGDVIKLNRLSILLYKKLIEWEKDKILTFERDTLWENGKPLNSYNFKHNYYFMGGDHLENSADSRYWGLVPEEYIAGKAWFIWKSNDLYTGKLRMERILKKLTK
ncbi:signal peptidase I [Capnocytophaga canis]|uniref:signal peptidase I n=1 Tax=Capnocytophaga canis TaxID=1848903 RepID=UPI0037D8DD6D